MSGSGMISGCGALGFLEDLGANVAGRDFAQRHHGGLVVFPLHRRFGAIGQLAGALGGHQHQLEQVRDVVERVFNRDTGHEKPRQRTQIGGLAGEYTRGPVPELDQYHFRYLVTYRAPPAGVPQISWQ